MTLSHCKYRLIIRVELLGFSLLNMKYTIITGRGSFKKFVLHLLDLLKCLLSSEIRPTSFLSSKKEEGKRLLKQNLKYAQLFRQDTTFYHKFFVCRTFLENYINKSTITYS